MSARVFRFRAAEPENGRDRSAAYEIRREIASRIARWRAQRERIRLLPNVPPPSTRDRVRQFIGENVWLLILLSVVAAASTWTLLGTAETWSR